MPLAAKFLIHIHFSSFSVMTSEFPMKFGLKVTWPLGKTEFIPCHMFMDSYFLHLQL